MHGLPGLMEELALEMSVRHPLPGRVAACPGKTGAAWQEAGLASRMLSLGVGRACSVLPGKCCIRAHGG